jgi:hypothetical protein
MLQTLVANHLPAPGIVEINLIVLFSNDALGIPFIVAKFFSISKIV